MRYRSKVRNNPTVSRGANSGRETDPERAMPLICSGARRGSVGLPGQKHGPSYRRRRQASARRQSGADSLDARSASRRSVAATKAAPVVQRTSFVAQCGDSWKCRSLRVWRFGLKTVLPGPPARPEHGRRPRAFSRFEGGSRARPRAAPRRSRRRPRFPSVRGGSLECGALAALRQDDGTASRQRRSSLSRPPSWSSCTRLTRR